MPKIPVAKQQIDPVTPRIDQPQIPNVSRGAFGEDVAASGASVSKFLDPVANLFERRAKELAELERQKTKADINSSISDEIQEQLFSEDKETVIINGQKVERNVGVFQNNGDLTRGQTQKLNRFFDRKLSDIYSMPLDKKTQQELVNDLMSSKKATMNQSVKYEVAQLKMAREESLETQINKTTEMSAGITNVEDLNDHLVKIGKMVDDKVKESNIDPDVADAQKKLAFEKNVRLSALGGLNIDPSGVTSNEIIDSQAEKVGIDGTSRLKKELKNEIANRKSQQKQQRENLEIQGGAEIINEFAETGQFNEDKIKAMNEEGRIPKNLLMAIKEYKSNPDSLSAGENDDIFLVYAGSMFSLDNQKRKSQFVADSLETYSSNEEGVHNLALMLKAANDYGQRKDIAVSLRKAISESTVSGVDPSKVVEAYVKELQENPDTTAQEAKDKVFAMFGIEESGGSFFMSPNPSSPENKGGFMLEMFQSALEMQTAGGLLTEGAKGGVSMIFSTPQAFGAFLKEYGESPEENPNFWNDTLDLIKKVSLPGYKQTSDIKKFADMVIGKKRIKDTSIKVGDAIIENNANWIIEQGLVRPEGDILGAIAFDAFGGGASLGISVGVATLSGNPIASATMFGFLQKGRIYIEARKEGLSPEEASKRSTTAGIIEGAIEAIGVGFLMKKFGSRIVGKGMKALSESKGMRALGQGIEEGLQQSGEDAVANWRNKGGLQKAKDAVYAAALGTFLGYGATFAIDSGSKKSLKDSGLSDEDILEIEKDVNNSIAKETQSVADEIEKGVAELQKARGIDIDATADQSVTVEAQGLDIQEQETQGIPTELQPLAKKAKKFDSAEEFIKSVDPDGVLDQKFLTDFYNTANNVEPSGEGTIEVEQPTTVEAVETESDGQQAEGTIVESSPETTSDRPPTQQQEAVAPTGPKKESKAFKRSVDQYNELKDQNPELYSSINIPDQIARAESFIEQNPELAKKVAYGHEVSPEGINREAVAIRYAEKMIEEGNWNEYIKATRSRSLRQTEAGQSIVLEKAASTNVNDVMHFMKQVLKARAANVGKKIFGIKSSESSGKTFSKIREKAIRAKNSIMNQKFLDIQEAQSIIDSLKC